MAKKPIEKNTSSDVTIKTSAKSDALKALQLVKNRLKKTIELNDKTEVEAHEVVSTGSAVIDEASGIGGIATGRCYMIYG